MGKYSELMQKAWDDEHPMTMMLELTYACNLDCSFCYNDTNLEGRPLAFEQYVALMDELAAMGCMHLTLTGGEPLAHKRFWDIGRAARERGFVVRIKSNGHAINETTARKLVREIDPYIIEVSLHGASAATHDRLTRVVGSHVRLLRNIRTMLDVGLRVKVNSTLTALNENELEGMFAIVDELDVPFRVDPEVKPRDDGDEAPLGITASREGIARLRTLLLERAHRRLAEVEVEPGPSKSRPIASSKHCGAGSNGATIDPYGNVLPCVQWRLPVGNLHEASFSEIWQGPLIDGVRRDNEEVKRRIDALGSDGQAAAFCPGLAHTYYGSPTQLYPAAKQRIRHSRERFRLPVLTHGA